jgi:hypothetical protein
MTTVLILPPTANPKIYTCTTSLLTTGTASRSSTIVKASAHNIISIET